MEIVKSKKGRHIVAWQGYLYRKDKEKINSVNWRCTKVRCPGRLTTRLAYETQDTEEEPPVATGNHTHPPNPVEVAVRQIQTTIKDRAVETNDPPRRIVQDALEAASEEVAVAVGSATNLRENVRRKRKRGAGEHPNPATRADVIVPPNLRLTKDGRQFLLFDMVLEPRLSDLCVSSGISPRFPASQCLHLSFLRLGCNIATQVRATDVKATTITI